jgi:hypothetical protein
VAKYRVLTPFVDAETRERRKKGDVMNVNKSRGDNLVARRLAVLIEEPKREEPVETAEATPKRETAAKRTKAE